MSRLENRSVTFNVDVPDNSHEALNDPGSHEPISRSPRVSFATGASEEQRTSLRSSFATALTEHEQLPDLLSENFLEENTDEDEPPRRSLVGSFATLMTEHEQLPDLMSETILSADIDSGEDLSTPSTHSHRSALTRRSQATRRSSRSHVAPPPPAYIVPTCREFPKWYWKRLTGIDQSLDCYGFYPSWDLIYGFVFTCLTLVILALIEHYGFYPLANHSIQAFIPAFGASCAVVFGIPKAPIAQPRNVLFAHVTAAIIGTALTNAFRSVSEQPFGQHCAGAIGVALHLVLMMLTETMHPPASATVVSAATQVINAYYKDEGFLFVVVPVLFGSVIVVVMACLLNNLVEDRSPFPQYW